ncbi:hypothetical protein [Nocardioides sp. B-3]|uniref:hypothetical protein n=1 Tax=Nocardioides sp. B-3 TaxID=2895565 RepID=UPI00215349BE|nr:hypothetical protein [Nocardioides sp. B-3]UUZ59456.1 hypothetical protein LP418_27350 [Nocardioides sp. B-3]
MSSPSTMQSGIVRAAAVMAPVGLFAYGALRWVDGRDGTHGPGLAWDLGHGAFLMSLVSFATMAVAIALATPRRSTYAAVVSTLLGASLFVWVTIGDLFPGFKEAAGLPDLLMNVGPPLLVLGFVAALHLAARAGTAPRYSAPLALVGFALIIVDLDLLPLAAVAHPAALAPLARRPRDRRA